MPLLKSKGGAGRYKAWLPAPVFATGLNKVCALFLKPKCPQQQGEGVQVDHDSFCFLTGELLHQQREGSGSVGAKPKATIHVSAIKHSFCSTVLTPALEHNHLLH